MTTILSSFCNLIWGAPMIILALGAHLYFTFKTGFIQKHLFSGIKYSIASNDDKGLSGLQVISTVLASTIGTGSIVGVASGILLGGPGTVFWCFICGLLGIATSYSENYLAVKFSVKDTGGIAHGGAFIWFTRVLNKPLLGYWFALCSLGVGLSMGVTIQSNVLYHSGFSETPQHVFAAILAVIVFLSVKGGLKSVANVCTALVVPLSVLYLLVCIWLLFHFQNVLWDSVGLIVSHAFSIRPAVFGGVTYSFVHSMRYGMSRGLFSNEAGLGSVPMVTVKGQGSAKQCALAACSSVFWDTLVVCTVTGLVLVCSMISTDRIFDDPIVLLEYTFSSFPVIGSLVFRISIVIFSYLTIVGWFCSAQQSASNLTGGKNCGWLSLLWSLVAAFGVITGQSILWSVADLLNAAMMIPNLYCLFCLRNEIQT